MLPLFVDFTRNCDECHVTTATCGLALLHASVALSSHTRSAYAPPDMIEHDLQDAIELARDAGRIILEQYGKVQRLTKTHIAASDEAVTEADRASQRLIVAGLKKRFPDDGVIGEESDTGQSITFD